MQIYANLHLHSTHSDGKYTPEELVRLAKEEGYGAIAVTDHDTVTANEALMRCAEENGLESIFGCEFTVPPTDDPLTDFHFVAFDFDPAYPPMAEYLKGMALRQTDKTVVTLERCHKSGLMTELSMEDVYEANPGIAWFCNEQVFVAMLKKGMAKPEDYEDWVESVWYHHEHLAPIPPAYAFKSAQEIIDLVHAAGGIILMAHPHNQLHFIDHLVAMGLDGLEVYHPDLDPEEQLEAMRIAYEKNLFIAGGTDHSGVLGGEYVSYEKPEECPYYLEPRMFGTMQEHFNELKARKIGKREYKHTHAARRGKYLCFHSKETKMRPYANLHLHSTHSDGKYTPEELVLLAKGEGYGAIAVTDHDTVTANEEVAYYAKKHGMESIFGCEFSVVSMLGKRADFHFVAFDFDPTYPPMAEYLRGMALRETDQTRIVFGWAVEKGDIQGITWEEILEYNKGIAWLCNDHVYRAMMAKGLVRAEDYEDWFNKNFRKQRGLVPPAYDFLPAEDLIRLVHEAGGIILVAHPYKRLQYMDQLIELGIDGLEVYHFSVSPEEQREALRIAYERNLFIAGGSDHEGALGGMYESFENPEDCPYYAEPRTFGAMKEHFDELKTRKIGKREKIPEYIAYKGKQK